MNIMYLKLLLVTLLFEVSCRTGMTKLSSRPLIQIEKNEAAPSNTSREIVADPKRSDFYVKERSLKIVPSSERSESGSLFNPDYQGNYLFATQKKLEVGDYLQVAVKQRQKVDAKSIDGAQVDSPSTSIGNGGGELAENAAGVQSTRQKLEEELLKELPDLTPTAADRPAMLTELAMEVTSRLANGDLMIQSRRNSISPYESHEIKVTARLPYSATSSGEPITTNDLVDVSLVDIRRGEVISRSATGWEDEYSLRLSGFDESKSIVARELQERQKKLTAARIKLEKRIRSFAAEKADVLKLRENLSERAATTTLNSEEKQPKSMKDSSAGDSSEKSAAQSRNIASTVNGVSPNVANSQEQEKKKDVEREAR